MTFDKQIDTGVSFNFSAGGQLFFLQAGKTITTELFYTKNIPLDDQTRQAKLCSQPVNLLGVQSLIKLVLTSMRAWTKLVIPRGGYLTKFNTGRLRPVQPLTLLYTILAEKVPLLYTFY